MGGQLPEGNGLSSTNDRNNSAPFNTLDEPIRDTIWRDVSAVGLKFKHVLYPVEKTSLLKEWDLWGPLILCTFMATILQSHIDDDKPSHQHEGDGGPEFAEVFVIVWVLGYCLLPLGIALAICRIILMASNPSMGPFILRCIFVLLGFIWSMYAATQFLGDCQPPKRKALAAYPMGLFYFVISWLVVSHN